MTPLPSHAVNWKWCVLPSLAMVLLSLIPQIHLWVVRGREWNGAYVSPQGDELLYSAYVNALIDGRTRKNDPFGGKDSSASAPLPESIFSIQSLPAYVVALPARAFGVSASTAFVVLIAVAALLASLSVFWLLNYVTRDPRVAAAGTSLVLCFGCVVGRRGIFGTFVDIGPAAFPFLRRYQPAAVFPLFFVFQLLVWRAFTSERKRSARVSSALAGLALVALIFSHLYLWTAAAAWLACIGALWLYFRPSDRRKTLAQGTTIAAIVAIALVPYGYLVSHRASTLDEQQIVISTHSPDLLRLHEVLGATILAALVIGIWRGTIDRADPRVIYVASLALLPFVVFNQQILTGRTMQVFHFEVAVVNYSTLVALLVTITLLWKLVPRRLLIWIAGLSFAWAVLLVALPARLLFVPQAIANDRTIPVLLRLKELSKQDGTLADLRTKGQASTLVFSPRVALIAFLPTWTSQGTLLDMTGVDCRGVTRKERKELFFMHLYYSNADTEALRKALNGTPDKSHDELSSVQTAIFGYERTSPALTPQFKPIQQDEIEREVQAYQTYANSFSRAEALKRSLTYAVIPSERSFNFANLDRWYERDAGERVGDYTLYRLKLRN
ncbi:MAG TPA: hypothetical protein VEM96_07555 [Pyrinomonadaceae bacterium]|nr:hypothetical protein [Pyrinomonadaceae bacterium]